MKAIKWIWTSDLMNRIAGTTYQNVLSWIISQFSKFCDQISKCGKCRNVARRVSIVSVAFHRLCLAISYSCCPIGQAKHVIFIISCVLASVWKLREEQLLTVWLRFLAENSWRIPQLPEHMIVHVLAGERMSYWRDYDVCFFFTLSCWRHLSEKRDKTAVESD